MVSLAKTEADAKAKAAEIDGLVETIEESIRTLARRGYKLFDQDNEEYYMTGEIKFDRKRMAFMFETDKEDM